MSTAIQPEIAQETPRQFQMTPPPPKRAPAPGAEQLPLAPSGVPPAGTLAAPPGTAYRQMTLAPTPGAPAPAAAPGQIPLANTATPGAPATPLAPLAPAIPTPTVQAPTQPVDRVALASSAFDTLQKAREPYDRRAREGTTSQAAGLGQLGSGQWRTSLANVDNERRLQLDTQRDALVNKATEGSIADASTAFQQALAGSQQGLAAELGRGNLDLGREGLDLAKTGQEGELGLSKEQLALQTKLGLGGMAGEERRIAIAEKEQAANEAYRNGTMTLAQRDATLRELSNAQQFGLQGEQLNLAKEGQSTQRDQFGQSLDFQKQQAAIDAQFKAGTMTLAQKDQALRELSNQQQFGLQGEQLALAKTGQTNQATQAAAQLAEQQASRLQQGGQFTQQLAEQTAQRLQNKSLEEARQIVDAEVARGSLTVQQGQLALSTLSNQQQVGLATNAQDLDRQRRDLDERIGIGQLNLAQTGQAQQAQQFAASLAQNATQFGATQAQQLQISRLTDATQNRSLDLSSEQGRQQLMVQLAQIMGGPTGAANPAFIAAVQQALGINAPPGATPPGATPPPGGTPLPLAPPGGGGPATPPPGGSIPGTELY